MPAMDVVIVTLASLLAGFVDAIVGGGGLILVPALFATYPTAPPATLLGNNKGASLWGTAMATLQFSRKVQLHWAALAPAAACGFVASLLGAWTVSMVSPDYLRKALPFILVAVLGYTLAKKELGRHPRTALCRPARNRRGLRHRRVAGLLRRLLRPRHRQFFSSSCSCACWATTS